MLRIKFIESGMVINDGKIRINQLGEVAKVATARATDPKNGTTPNTNIKAR